MIYTQLVIIALSLWIILMLHRGLSVTIQLPDRLTQEVTASPVHHRPWLFFLCDERGKVRTEVHTLNFEHPPEEYVYGNVRYTRHSMTSKTAQYRPQKT